MPHITAPMGAARYVGRVGALAFALGLGAAIASGTGTALADTGDSQAATATSNSTPTARGPAATRRTQNIATGRGIAAHAVQSPGSPGRPVGAMPPEMLGWARRDAAAATQSIGSTLLARTPRLAYNAAQNTQAPDGGINGALNASQPDGYHLTYTASTPQHGSATVNPDGTFTYTPTTEFAARGGTDTFTVSADDQPGNPQHWHGLATFLLPGAGHTTTASVTVLENPGPAQPPSVIATTDQLDAELTAARLANAPLVALAKGVLKVGWILAGQKNFALIGGPDAANMARLDQALNEYAVQAALEVQLLDSANPKVIQQVAPPHDWYLQNFPGSRIWYDNPDTIYRFIGVNSVSSYVLTGRFDPTKDLPADTNFSVLTGLGGNTADNLNYRDMEIKPDGTFTITVSSAPAALGEKNHLQLVPGTTLITTRNTMSDWNSQDPMSLSVLKVSGPPSSLFSQIGGFAFPGIGPLVAGNPLLTSLVSLIPPLPGGRLLQSIETAAIMLVLGISGENQYMGVATTDPKTGTLRPPNMLSDPDRNAQFLSTQLQSAGYFQLADNQALVINVDPGNARYFNLPVTDIWTITGNYWDAPTSLNMDQASQNQDGTYTFVISPTDPGLANWVSTGGLNIGTISMRFQDFDLSSSESPTVSSQVVLLSELPPGLPAFTPEQRAAQIANRQLGYNRRWAPYPQA